MKVFGFTGYSGSGKTTLIEQLIPRMVMEGLRVSLIKHAHHGFDIDKPGKDSFRQREAGASEVMLISDRRWVLMHELRGAPEPSLDEQLRRMSPCDVVLVEGFKFSSIPKIEVHRPANGKPLIAEAANLNIVARASDVKMPQQPGMQPWLDLNDPDGITEFVLNHLGLRVSTS